MPPNQKDDLEAVDYGNGIYGIRNKRTGTISATDEPTWRTLSGIKSGGVRSGIPVGGNVPGGEILTKPSTTLIAPGRGPEFVEDTPEDMRDRWVRENLSPLAKGVVQNTIATGLAGATGLISKNPVATGAAGVAGSGLGAALWDLAGNKISPKLMGGTTNPDAARYAWEGAMDRLFDWLPHAAAKHVVPAGFNFRSSSLKNKLGKAITGDISQSVLDTLATQQGFHNQVSYDLAQMNKQGKLADFLKTFFSNQNTLESRMAGQKEALTGQAEEILSGIRGKPTTLGTGNQELTQTLKKDIRNTARDRYIQEDALHRDFEALATQNKTNVELPPPAAPAPFTLTQPVAPIAPQKPTPLPAPYVRPELPAAMQTFAPPSAQTFRSGQEAWDAAVKDQPTSPALQAYLRMRAEGTSKLTPVELMSGLRPEHVADVENKILAGQKKYLNTPVTPAAPNAEKQSLAWEKARKEYDTGRQKELLEAAKVEAQNRAAQESFSRQHGDYLSKQSQYQLDQDEFLKKQIEHEAALTASKTPKVQEITAPVWLDKTSGLSVDEFNRISSIIDEQMTLGMVRSPIQLRNFKALKAAAEQLLSAPVEAGTGRRVLPYSIVKPLKNAAFDDPILQRFAHTIWEDAQDSMKAWKNANVAVPAYEKAAAATTARYNAREAVKAARKSTTTPESILEKGLRSASDADEYLKLGGSREAGATAFLRNILQDAQNLSNGKPWNAGKIEELLQKNSEVYNKFTNSAERSNFKNLMKRMDLADTPQSMVGEHANEIRKGFATLSLAASAFNGFPSLTKATMAGLTIGSLQLGDLLANKVILDPTVSRSLTALTHLPANSPKAQEIIQRLLRHPGLNMVRMRVQIPVGDGTYKEQEARIEKGKIVPTQPGQ